MDAVVFAMTRASASNDVDLRQKKADADALLTERIRVSGGGTHGLPNPPPRPVRRRAFLPGAKAQKLPENATPNGETCTSTPATRPE